MNDTRHIWESSYPADINWNAPIKGHSVHELLENTAREYGDRPGINFMGKVYKWAAIDTYSKKLARGLQDIGIKKGDHVGLMMPNCPYFIFAYYAVLRIGAIVVHYNPLYSCREIKSLIADSQTTTMITTNLDVTWDKTAPFLDDEDSPLKRAIVCPFEDSLPPLKSFLFRIFKRSDMARIAYERDDIHSFASLTANNGQYSPVQINAEEDLALLQFTGGTTGTPKAAMLTHANLTANTEQSRLWFTGAREGQEKIAAVLPFFHVFAMTAILNLGTRLAMEIYPLPRFDLKNTLKMIDRSKITFFPAVPAIYNGIVNHKKISHYDLSSVRACISGGAPLPEEVKKRFEELTGCILVEGYGLTETSPVACVNPLDGKNKSGSIGLPLPQTDVALYGLDDEKDTRVTGDERGELCIKGPQVMKGYFDRDEETKNSFNADGYLRTGDVAIMDEDGYFFIVDRIKDLIISNGYNIYPRAVEEAIYLHPAVEECIVAGIPDKNRGEVVKAWVKLKDGKTLNASDLKSFLQDKLSPLEMPRQIEFRDEELPKTMIGKLSRKDILKEENNKNGGSA